MEHIEAFTLANNMASSGLKNLGKNVILTYLILTIDGTIGYTEMGTWCQGVRHQLVILQDPIPTKYC